MRFIGGIPASSKGVFADIVKNLGVDNDFVVLTSGTFSFESILSGLKVRSIYSNDVSLLTSMYGYGIKGKGEMIKIKIKNPMFDALREFENKSIEDNLGIILSVYYASEFVNVSGARGKWMKDSIIASIVEIFKKQRDGGKNILERVKRLGIKDFIGVDLVSLLDDDFLNGKIPVAFLPTYNGGYEKIYQFLDESIEWDRPNYSLITKENYDELNQKVVDRGGVVLVDRLSGISDLVASCETSGKKIFFHCKIDKKYISGTKEKINFYDVEIWDGEVKEVKEVEVIPIDRPSFTKLRDKFISIRNYALGGVDYCFGVFFDGKIVGLIGVCDGFKEGVFLLKTDLSFVNKNRISKLIVMLSCSDEVLNFISSKFSLNIKFYGLNTIIFTKNAVSMKYRGIGEVTSRREDRLTYFIPRIKGNAKEIFELWLKKFYRA